MAVDHLRQRRHPVARDLGAVLLVRVQFEKFNETYGSLGAVIGFMWISAIVILLGAELDAWSIRPRATQRRDRLSQWAAGRAGGRYGRCGEGPLI